MTDPDHWQSLAKEILSWQTLAISEFRYQVLLIRQAMVARKAVNIG